MVGKKSVQGAWVGAACGFYPLGYDAGDGKNYPYRRNPETAPRCTNLGVVHDRKSEIERIVLKRAAPYL